MQKFKLYNSIFGWVVFAVSTIVYLLTAEPTASLWDCGEFIASAYKLQIGHPPGAPFFIMLARIFSLFAGNDAASVARMVNYMSTLASGFTILFLFWTITHIAKKIVLTDESNIKLSNIIIVIGSGIVGALAYTFSDTFWFSAVEGEVYALSSLFTAVVFWAILKWEDIADEKHVNKWLILISYLMGLSIGVHLLNLLAIPAIVLVYYFRKYKPSWKGLLIAFFISLLILATIMYGVIQGSIIVASKIELFTVNSLGLPFNSGLITFIILLSLVLIYGIYYSIKKNKKWLNLSITCIAMLYIGYSSYAMIVLRSLADPPINENNPSNVFSLLSYLDREQYGDRPLFFGQYFNAPITDFKKGKPRYAALNGKYEIIGYEYNIKYDDRFTTFFPRMYSSDPNHIKVYKDWTDMKGRMVQVNEDGKIRTEYVPTFGENMRFFFKYQIGHMYMRYFLWNFVGRQNDEEGSGILSGNWISGINFIDEKLIGPQKNVPENIKNIPSRNTYYFLPFILGLIGLMFLLDKSKKYFTVTTLLFLFTGIAIVIYLNQTPLQPRERDYAYAGSFYAFAIWIGLGIISLYQFIKLKKYDTIKALSVILICLFLVPGIMANENWDDHNRSHRYLTRSYAYNYLMSCAPNAILFTYGDNDTFPLWYLQEVEGIRTDVRVVNTMLLNSDWYIDQMKKKVYQSEPLPISMDYEKYIEGRRTRVYLLDQIKEYIPLSQAISFVASDDPRTKKIPGYEEDVDYISAKNFTFQVDTNIVFKNGTVKRKDASRVVKEIKFTLKTNSILKSNLIMLDIIANNNWVRPIYFVSPYPDGTCWLNEYLQIDGFAYRLVPIYTPVNENQITTGHIDTEILYNNLMNKFDFANVNSPKVYVDNFHRRTLSIMRIRETFAKLAQALIYENKKDSALKVLNKCYELLPKDKLPYDYYSLYMVNLFSLAGDNNKASEILKDHLDGCCKMLDYLINLPPQYQRLCDYELNFNYSLLNNIKQIAISINSPLINEINEKLNYFKNKSL